MPLKDVLLGTCLAVVMFICSTQQDESKSKILTWTITNTTDSKREEIYFARESFGKFYSCLCQKPSKECYVSRGNDNFAQGHIVVNSSANSTFLYNNYECFPKMQDGILPINCKRINPSGNSNLLPQYCTRYSVNESLLNITCNLPFVELSAATNILIIPTVSGDDVIITSPVECSVNTLPPTMYGTSTIGLEQTTTFKNLSNTSLFTSSPSSSSSSLGLTKEHIIIICLAAGIVIIISALVILGIILWRRHQNSRDKILSKAPTIHKTQCENDNGIVNHGGDFSLEDEIMDPYYTSKLAKASDVEASNLTSPYTTLDVDMATVNFTTAAIKSKNESDIKLDERAKHYLPSGSENPYAEPEVIAEANPIADSDKTMWKITNLSKKSKNVNNPNPAVDTNTKGAPSASRDLHSKLETDNVTEAYAVVNPSTKLNQARSKSTKTASLPNKSDNEDLDILTDDVSVLYHAPSSKYGNSNLNVNSSLDSECALTKDVDKGLPGSCKLYYASTDIVNSNFVPDHVNPQDTHEYFILERNYESSASNESEDV